MTWSLVREESETILVSARILFFVFTFQMIMELFLRSLAIMSNFFPSYSLTHAISSLIHHSPLSVPIGRLKQVKSFVRQNCYSSSLQSHQRTDLWWIFWNMILARSFCQASHYQHWEYSHREHFLGFAFTSISPQLFSAIDILWVTFNCYLFLHSPFRMFCYSALFDDVHASWCTRNNLSWV